MKDSIGNGEVKHTRKNIGNGDYIVYCYGTSSRVTIESGIFPGAVRTVSGTVTIKGGTFSGLTVDDATVSIIAGKFTDKINFMSAGRTLVNIVAEGSYAADLTTGDEISGWKNQTGQDYRKIWIRSQADTEKQTPKITVDLPEETIYCKTLETKSLSVTASVDEGTLAYQWFQSAAKGGAVTEISGATDANYTIPTQTAGTTYYYVVVTNTTAGVSVKSKTAEVTVSEAGHGPGGTTVNNNAALQTALGGSGNAAIGDDGVVKLTQNVTLDSNIRVTGTVSLDLNGCTLSFGGETASQAIYNALFYVNGSGDLTVKDSIGNGEVKHTRNNIGKGDYIVYCYGTSSRVTIENGIFSGTVRTGSGTVTIKGGTFSGLTVDNARAVSISAGEFRKISFMDNTALRMKNIIASGVYVADMDGNQISGWEENKDLYNVSVVPLGTGYTMTWWLQEQIDKSSGSDAAPAEITVPAEGKIISTINVPAGKYVKLTGAALTRAVDSKFVPLFDVKGGLILENITLDGNKENGAGGDGLVEVDGGKLTLEEGASLQNSSGMNGGAVRICNNGLFTMNGGQITGNEASAGGGVFVFNYIGENGGSFVMNGGEIIGNTAEAGSGVYLLKGSTFKLHDGTISGNAAPENVSQEGWDGIINVEIRPQTTSTWSISNTQIPLAFTYNQGIVFPSSPDSWGGGVYNMGAFTMDGGEISGNTAGRGGAVYHADGSCEIIGGTIAGNHNTDSGTGLYIRENASIGDGTDISDGIYLAKGKKILVSSALTSPVIIEGMEGDVTAGTVIAEGSGYIISDDDFAKFTCQTCKWILKKNADGQIILAVNSSAAPVFTTSTYTKVSANENTAKFTLDSAADSSTGFKVYEAETGGDALTDVTAEAQGTTLTLTGISGVTSETDYYISATETGKSESSRTAVTVNPYAPVTLGDENSDKTVKVTFLTTDADTVTKNDTIDVVFHKGTNPDDTFKKEDFSFFNGDNKKADREVIDDLTVTNVDEEKGTLTVTMAKSVAPTDHKAYLWYRYNDTTDYYVGEIIIDKTVKTPSIPPDTKTQAPVLESATAVFASDAANSVTYTLKSVPENTTYQLYGEQEGGDALSAPTMTLDTDKKTLTLTFASKPTEDTDYYLAATEQGKEESSRVAITVRKYAAPSAALGEDSTVAVKFQSSDEGTVTDTDTVKVILNKGTNPDYSFTSDLFSLSSSNLEKKAIDDLSITGLNVDEGTITVQMAKRVTAETAYLWYGEQSIGQITISKTVETPQSSDKQITGFTIADQIGETEFDQTDHTIKVTMPAGTAVTNLKPTITVSTGAAVSPESEVAQDFSSPVTYTVTAEDGSTQDYTVTVEAESQINLISEVDVTGITTPVAGATPDTSAKDGTHWSAGTVTWDPNHTAFAYETQYTASVTITAAEGYQFAKEGALTATVDGEDAEITRTSDTVITVSYEFPATDAEGDTYRVTYNLTNLTADEQPEQVEKDGELEATLTAEEGYELPDTITVKMDGQTLTAGSDYTYDSESGTVRITTVTGNVVITAEGVSDGTFIAVTNITGVPEFMEVGKALKLKGTVKPSNATNQEIQWEVTDEGETGAEIDEENNLTAGASGEIIVTATITDGTADGEDYTQKFTIKVVGVASSSDAEYVASASNAVGGGRYEVEQSTTEDESSFLTELVNLINKILENLFGTGKTEKIETSDISNLEITVDPVAGDEDDHSGSDGEFTFDVEIHKGDESQTVEGLTGIIKATPFTDEDQAAKDQEAVDNAITEIEDGTYNVQQENAGNEAALKKALKEKAKKKAGKATVNEIQIVEVEYATAGTLENPDGEAGTFTFKAKVSKGSVQDIWTEEIEGTIVPEEYVLKKPEITTLSLPDGTVGTEYSAQLTAKSDTEITWGLEGSLPAGLTLSEDGEISGRPEVAGQTSFKVTADNGSEQGTASRNYTITINAKTGETEHTIMAVSGDGGTMNPSGAVRVADGADQKFTITPANGYYISKVLVDGNSVGRPAEYTFRNVTGDHTIEVEFARGSVGPGTDDGDDDKGEGSHSSGSGSTGTTSKTPSTSTNTATVEGGSVTTTTTTSTDNSGKKTTVTTQVTQDTAGNVTGSTTTVTTDNIQISVGEGVSHVTVRPDGSAMNSAAASVGATVQNPLRVQIEVPHTAAVNEFAKPEVQSVAVDVMIPNAAANNPNVEIGVTIGKETIQAAKDAGKNVAVTVRNENGTVEAVWSFDGAAMRNTNSETADVSLGLHAVPVQSEDPSAQAVKPLAAARGTENGLVLDISGAGRLTAPTKLTVPATNQTGIKAGDQVALYRHDPLTGTLVPMPGGSYTVDVNGNVTIDLPAKDFAAGPDRYVLLPVLAAGTVPPAIPATAGATTPYEIKRGDTLNKIAREYGCTVEELLELNQVDVMDLRIGQVIQLPAR